GILDKDKYMRDPMPAFTDAANGFGFDGHKDVTLEQAGDNLQAAIKNSFDTCKWLARVKRSVTHEYLKSEGWTVIYYSTFGKTQDNPLDIIKSLNTIRASEARRNEIELLLLSLVGIDAKNGYMHDDVVYAVSKTKSAFGNKFSWLNKNF